MEPFTITCCGCCLLLGLLFLTGGNTHTHQTVIMTPYGQQTVATDTKTSMTALQWILFIIVMIPVIIVLAGVLYVWANSL